MNQKNIKSIIIAVIIIFIIILYGCSNKTTQNPSQIPNTPSTETEKIVNLGEKFTLVKGESARVKGLNVSLKVKEFIYSPCPKGVQCVWSGLAVVYELNIDGKAYTNSYYTPYDVLVSDTDHKTYAKFTIEKAETNCKKKNGISQDECWRQLAKRINDSHYCDKINDLLTKDACFEEMAEILVDKELCKKVSTANQYCLYTKLIDRNNLSQCDSIIIFHWRVRCFKEIAEKSGKGIDICNNLESNKAKVCKEVIIGPDY